MSFVEIPIQPVPTQSFLATLDDGTAQMTLTTTDIGLLADVVYEGVPVANGRLCLDRTNLNTATYLGLPRGLYFVDLRGTSDPQWANMGPGARFRLYYGDPDTEGGSTVA